MKDKNVMDITEFSAYEGHEVWSISPEEIDQAENWFAENKGKWENWKGFRFLVPEEEVPEVVLRLRKIEEFSLRYIKYRNDLRMKNEEGKQPYLKNKK